MTPAFHRRTGLVALASVDTGFIGQNVYLFCASEGLATVFRGAVDHPKLARAMTLPEQQFVTFAQTVGYPRP
jgi:nitroreductase